MALHARCIAGASTKDNVIMMLKNTGFYDIRVNTKEESKSFIKDCTPGSLLRILLFLLTFKLFFR